MKYRHAGKEKRLTFGGRHPEVSSSEARAERDRARALLREHRDPATEKSKRKMAVHAAAGAPFKVVATRWHEAQKPRWPPVQVEQALERAVYPAFGSTIAGMVVTGGRVGIAATKSADLEIAGNRLDCVRSDGVNLAMVQHVRVVGNQCLNFRPIAAIYDVADKLVKDSDHADCIQGWSRLTYSRPATS